jgi:hypothetical protein
LIDPHGLNSALVGKHLLLSCPASAGLFLRCRHSNQPPAARLKGVGEPTGALRERQVGNPGGGRKSLASWRGFFCRGPRAWRNQPRGSTFLLRACRQFWARVSERPESSGWLAGPQLVDDDEPITLCPLRRGFSCAPSPLRPACEPALAQPGAARHPAQRLPLHLPTLLIIVTERMLLG